MNKVAGFQGNCSLCVTAYIRQSVTPMCLFLFSKNISSRFKCKQATACSPAPLLVLTCGTTGHRTPRSTVCIFKHWTSFGRVIALRITTFIRRPIHIQTLRQSHLLMNEVRYPCCCCCCKEITASLPSASLLLRPALQPHF